MDNVLLGFDSEDHRPALIGCDIEQLEMDRFRAAGTRQSPELIRLIDVKNAFIRGSGPTSPVPVFLSVYGELSNTIILKDNFIRNATNAVFLEKQELKGFVETGSVK